MRIDDRGAVVNDNTLCTDHPDIYAYGDVIGQGIFKHISSAEGELAYRNSQNDAPDARRAMDCRTDPHAVFSDPEVPAVGLRGDECAAQGLNYRSATHEYADFAKGKIVGAPAGFAKLLMENHSERILGCHIVGPDAALLLHDVVVAINTAKARADLVRCAIHIHPSLPGLGGTLFDNA